MSADGLTQTLRWRVFSDADELSTQAAKLVLQAARAAIAERGVFHLVLAGGRTPQSVYARLRTAEADWGHWRIYFGDERCLPAGDAARNDVMARRAWLDHVPMARGHVYSIPAEQGAERAALAYQALLSGVDEFDLVLLGLGEDGHTASLFRGHALGDTPPAPAALAVHDAPKLPAERVSLSAARLSRARQVLFLVAGADKRQALAAWRAGEDIPARHITPATPVEVYADNAAAGDR